jgi:uncharacterized protein
MEFALNYSPQAARLLEDGQIRIDLFKCPPWPELIAEAERLAPVYVHFDLRIGDRRPATTTWAMIDEVLATTRTQYVNIHFAPLAQDMGFAPDSTAPADADRIRAHAAEALQPLIARFGAERIILENLAYLPSFGKDTVLAFDPDIIRQVVEDNGIGFLLDLSHAAIVARHLDRPLADDLARMPVDRLRELHVTGLRHMPAIDEWHDHFELGADDWEALEAAGAQIASGAWAAPGIMAFEYGGIGPLFDYRSESRVLAEQVPQLVAFAARVNQAGRRNMEPSDAR